jgi:hypothetical protein
VEKVFEETKILVLALSIRDWAAPNDRQYESTLIEKRLITVEWVGGGFTVRARWAWPIRISSFGIFD